VIDDRNKYSSQPSEDEVAIGVISNYAEVVVENELKPSIDVQVLVEETTSKKPLTAEDQAIRNVGEALMQAMNIEEDLVVNTLDEIQKHQGLIRLLDSQPRLEDILYKKVGGEVELRKDEIFVFYTTFVELQKLLQKSLDVELNVDGDRRAQLDVLERAIQENDSLVKFFFKLLYAADSTETIPIKEITDQDLNKARRTFEYLTLLLPFL